MGSFNGRAPIVKVVNMNPSNFLPVDMTAAAYRTSKAPSGASPSPSPKPANIAIKDEHHHHVIVGSAASYKAPQASFAGAPNRSMLVPPNQLQNYQQHYQHGGRVAGGSLRRRHSKNHNSQGRTPHKHHPAVNPNRKLMQAVRGLPASSMLVGAHSRAYNLNDLNAKKTKTTSNNDSTL